MQVLKLIFVFVILWTIWLSAQNQVRVGATVSGYIHGGYVTASDTIYLQFMEDSIKVLEHDANGILELVLIGIEVHGVNYFNKVENTKFLRLPQYIRHQVINVLQKKR